MKYNVIRTELGEFIPKSNNLSITVSKKVGTYATESRAECAIQRFVTKYFEKESVNYERMDVDVVRDTDNDGKVKYVMWNVIAEKN